MTSNGPHREAQLGAQPDAQLGEKNPWLALDQVLELMRDEPSFATEVCLRVLERHAIPQHRLAARCDIRPGTLSRILSGAYPMQWKVIRELFAMTGDRDLLSLFSDDGGEIIRVAVGREQPGDVTSIFVNVSRATHEAQMKAHRLLIEPGPKPGSLASQTMADIDTAIANLSSLRRVIERRVSANDTTKAEAAA